MAVLPLEIELALLESNAITRSKTRPQTEVTPPIALAKGLPVIAQPRKLVRQKANAPGYKLSKLNTERTKSESKRRTTSKVTAPSDKPKQQRARLLKVSLPGPEAGGPETGREFAARMKDRFVLKGPRDPKEGGSIPVTQKNANKNQASTDVFDDANSGYPNEDVVPPASLIRVVKDTAGIDLMDIVRSSYAQDHFFKLILESPKDYRNFEVEDGCIFMKGDGERVLCIPKALYNGRSIREIVISEAHGILVHLSVRKTLAYLRDHVWWKDMVKDTTAHCESCATCRRSKPDNQKPYGLLHMLKVPSEPWDSIGIDFVGPLPESSDRDGTYDCITVVIDRLTGMVHLVPSQEDYTACEIAELVFAEVYKYHGLPRTIVSDRDKWFTAAFWDHLHKLIGTKLNMSSAYHPESDGATERANKTMIQMIRQCIGPKQKDWASKLPAIEFALNSAQSETTGFAPFFLNYGRMPRSFIWNHADKNEFPGV